MAVNQVRNVYDYGGNIQAAIDSLPASGGEVYIPAGAYTIAGSITIAKNNVTINGAGPATILVSTAVGSDAVIGFYGVNNCRLSNLFVSGVGYDAGSLIGINISGCRDTIISDCIVKGIGEEGIMVQRSYRQNISNNLVSGCGTYGIRVYLNGADTKVSNNFVYYNGIDGTHRHGIQVEKTSGALIEFNHCFLNGGAGIHTRQGLDVSIVGNICWNNSNTSSGAYDGISLYLDTGIETKNVAVQGNICYDTRASGAKTQSAGMALLSAIDNVQIVGNTFRNNMFYGIDVNTPSKGTIVSSNTIVDNLSYGIRINSGSNVVVQGNICRDNSEGIYVQGSCTSVIINGNICYDSSSVQGYGIYFNGVGNDYIVVTNNIVRNNLSGGVVGALGANSLSGNNIYT